VGAALDEVTTEDLGYVNPSPKAENRPKIKKNW